MKNIILAFTLIAFFAVESAVAQGKYFTRDGKISFNSSTPLEDIEAHNYKATSVVDTESGRMEFAVLIKAFEFEKALMQEHFNENYMESDKFPKAIFKGKIDNMAVIDWSEDGDYDVTVSGDLTIHGVSNSVSTKGHFVIKEGEVKATSSFTVAVADYDIKIPSVVRDNIAKEVEIVVDMDYKPFNK